MNQISKNFDTYSINMSSVVLSGTTFITINITKNGIIYCNHEVIDTFVAQEIISRKNNIKIHGDTVISITTGRGKTIHFIALKPNCICKMSSAEKLSHIKKISPPIISILTKKTRPSSPLKYTMPIPLPKSNPIKIKNIPVYSVPNNSVPTNSATANSVVTSSESSSSYVSADESPVFTDDEYSVL